MNSEQNTTSPRSPRWFRSSYSGSGGGDCVEVAAASRAVHVRDSKDRQGPVLGFSHEEWSAFVAYVSAEIRVDV